MVTAKTAIAKGLGGLTAVGALGLGYAVAESRAYTLRRFDLPVLPPGASPLRVLHLSDLHLTPRHRREVDWVRGLAALEPDLVIDTGDNLAHLDTQLHLLSEPCLLDHELWKANALGIANPNDAGAHEEVLGFSGLTM